MAPGAGGSVLASSPGGLRLCLGAGLWDQGLAGGLERGADLLLPGISVNGYLKPTSKLVRFFNV